MTIRISRDDRLQNRFPSIGAVHIAGAQSAAFQMAKLVEDEQRVIAHAAEMPVPGRAFLRAVGRADRTVHVQRDPFGRLALVNPVDPLSRHISQRRAIVSRRQHLGLEPSHLACGRGLGINGPSSDHLPHHRIKRQTICIIHILISGQPTED